MPSHLVNRMEQNSFPAGRNEGGLRWIEPREILSSLVNPTPVPVILQTSFLSFLVEFIVASTFTRPRFLHLAETREPSSRSADKRSGAPANYPSTTAELVRELFGRAD